MSGNGGESPSPNVFFDGTDASAYRTLLLEQETPGSTHLRPKGSKLALPISTDGVTVCAVIGARLRRRNFHRMGSSDAQISSVRQKWKH